METGQARASKHLRGDNPLYWPRGHAVSELGGSQSRRIREEEAEVELEELARNMRDRHIGVAEAAADELGSKFLPHEETEHAKGGRISVGRGCCLSAVYPKPWRRQ